MWMGGTFLMRTVLRVWRSLHAREDLAGIVAGVVEYGHIRATEKLGKFNAGGEVHVSGRIHNLLDTCGALLC